MGNWVSHFELLVNCDVVYAVALVYAEKNWIYLYYMKNKKNWRETAFIILYEGEN